MTSSVAPAQPLAPCHSCGAIPERATRSESARCSDRACFMSVYWTPISQWNRRAEPPAPAGEVGAIQSALSKLDSQIMRHEAGACEGGLLPACYAEILVDARRELAALTAQAARAEEAEGRAERDMRTAIQIGQDYHAAESALLALGCRMGPDGWEQHFIKCPCRMAEEPCGPDEGCKGTGRDVWIPISAPAKGEGET